MQYIVINTYINTHINCISRKSCPCLYNKPLFENGQDLGSYSIRKGQGKNNVNISPKLSQVVRTTDPINYFPWDPDSVELRF